MRLLNDGSFKFMPDKACNKSDVDPTHFLATSRFKFKAWMRESNWSLWILMTDHSSKTNPKYARIDAFGFQFLIDSWARSSKGSNDEPNGPNMEKNND